jgi:VPDSG-CTERM motif
MKNKFMFLASAAVLALTGLSANANTISIGSISVTPDGTGGTLWHYQVIFDNTHISSTQPTQFNLNDFGSIKGGLGGVTFAPLDAGNNAVGFTVDNTMLVGPNYGLPGFEPNNASVLDVVITFTSDADMGLPSATFELTLDTALTGMGGLANFFSHDIVQSGLAHGQPNAAQQVILTPGGQNVPDGGTTVALLGIALAGLEGVRRMFRARKS